MKKETALALIISCTIIALTIIGVLIIKNVQLSPQSVQPICNTLKFSSPSAINLVFFAEKEKAEKYSEALFDIYPLNKNKDSFNIYYITDNIECELYKNAALFCHSRELIKKAATCPNDYIFVLKSHASSIRSSSYLNVLSINTNHPLSVIAHEFGHAFANLAEEYTPAKLPSGVKNCVESCPEFNGLDEGCFQGCSTNNYYRSIDSGIMRSLHSPKFGKFNEILIENRISKDKQQITGLAISTEPQCENQFFHVIKGSYSKPAGITIKEKTVEQGCIGTNGGQQFTYKIKDSSNNYISSDSFNPELIFTDAQTEGQALLSGETDNYEGEFYLKVQNMPDSNYLEIFDNENKLIKQTSLKPIRDDRPCKI
ncbi:MAG: hypothetical protein AABW80_02425 [Nanoarchaeota archaeon]